MSAGTVRAFIALELEADCRGRIATLMGDLRRELHDVRWVSPEQLHLTLRFLGDVSREALDRLQPRLAAAASLCPPQQVAVRGLGVFPERGAPRVLWLGIDLPEPIVALQAACESAARSAGLPSESRPFRAHLTLGRWRGAGRRPQLGAGDLGSTRLSRLILFQSELRPQGAIHTPLAVFALGSAA